MPVNHVYSVDQAMDVPANTVTHMSKKVLF